MTIWNQPAQFSRVVKPAQTVSKFSFTKLNNWFCSGHLSAVAAAALQFLRNFSGREETTNSTSEPGAAAAALDSQCAPAHSKFLPFKNTELARSFKSPHLKTILHCIYILNTKSQKLCFLLYDYQFLSLSARGWNAPARGRWGAMCVSGLPTHTYIVYR